MSENDIEAQITGFLDLVLPPEVLHFHIPNAGKRGWKQQREMKNAGIKAGIPDRCILWEGRAFFIETKTKTGRASDAQKSRIEWLNEHGFPTRICRSSYDVAQFLTECNIPLSLKFEM